MWWLQRVTGAGLVSMSTPLIWLECVALWQSLLFVNLTKDDVVQWLLKVMCSICSYFSAFKDKSQLNSYSLSIRQLMSFCLNQLCEPGMSLLTLMYSFLTIKPILFTFLLQRIVGINRWPDLF